MSQFLRSFRKQLIDCQFAFKLRNQKKHKLALHHRHIIFNAVMKKLPHVINGYGSPKPCQFTSWGRYFPFSTFIFSISIVLSACCPAEVSNSVLHSSFISLLRVFESIPDMPETFFHPLMPVGKQRVCPILLTQA